jgi:hypothetical protein
MTATAFPAGILSPRPALGSLLWIAPLTLLWTMLIYWQPIISASGVPTAAPRLMAYGLIGLGLWLGLESTDLTSDQRRTTWLAVMIPYTLWMAIAWSAAINGIFRTGALPAPVPLLPLAIFLPVMIGAPLLLLSKRVGQVLDAMPVTWLVALQLYLYRVFGSWALVGGLRGSLPSVFGVPAGIGDMLTGVFAVPAAIAVATGTAQGRRAAIAWNILGRHRDHLGVNNLARPVPVDRPGCVEHRRWRLSGCTDPGFRCAKLDPAALTLAAPTPAARPSRGGAALDARLGEAARQAFGDEVLGHIAPSGRIDGGQVVPSPHHMTKSRTSPASPPAKPRWEASGLSCSQRSRRDSSGPQSCSIPTFPAHRLTCTHLRRRPGRSRPCQSVRRFTATRRSKRPSWPLGASREAALSSRRMHS